MKLIVESKKRYTITSALPYTNGPLHIGHLAGAYIPADIYARFKRITDNDVAYICGSDEHGVAISIRAKKENKTPKEVIDKYHALIKKSFDDFGISFDNYSRTSSKIHHETASEFFKFLNEKNCFEIKNSKQLYDPVENQFLADRFVEGECPHCGFEHAYGDQCENCGSSLSPEQLINPISKISGSKPIEKETTHWYLPLGKYVDFINDWFLKDKKDSAKSNVYGQVKSWIDQGLESRAITRDLDWGIPIQVDGDDGKVLYVWFEAPIGYISSTKEWAAKNNKDWEHYWKSPNTNLIHFIGKDNIVFHCVIFPIMLKMFGDFILPKNVPANEFLNLEGEKISTSKNWAVWLHEYLLEFPNMQDVLRYVLTATCPETKDNDFTWKEFQTRNNSELVAVYGNFTNRVLSLIDKYYDGNIPRSDSTNNIDNKVLEEVKVQKNQIMISLNNFKFREALKNLMNIARLGNKYLADSEPWKIKNDYPERVEEILNVSFIIVSYLAILSEPFIPFTSIKLKDMIGIKEFDWDNLDNLKNEINFNFKIKNKEMLFRRIEDTEIEFQKNKLFK